MLNLNDSKLEGTIPESLGNVATLTHIYIASNSFQGPVPTSVASLPNLQVVNFGFNRLDGSLPRFESTFMTTMELGHNQFTGQLSANATDGMSGLEIFDIQYNLVTGTIPPLTASLPSLVELDLSNNQFIGKFYCPFRRFTIASFRLRCF
jgi:Leucine-rich repeat (LRR) protein